MLRAINYSRGVACLVHFGSHYPSIGKNEINTLRREVNDDEIIVINQKFEPSGYFIITGEFCRRSCYTFFVWKRATRLPEKNDGKHKRV